MLDQGPFRSDISEEDGVCPGSGRSSHPEFEGVEDLPGADLLASPAGGARAAVGLYATLGDVPIPDDRQSLLGTFPHASPAPYASLDDAGQDGPVINLRSGITHQNWVSPIGITGTGVIALIYAALRDERIRDSRIVDGSIRITRRIRFTDADLKEAGKAIGAIRAGHMTLMNAAGVSPEEIRTMYMAGATGTYVDPFKARDLGLVIPRCTRMVQVGNTSLELAKDLAREPVRLDELNELRDRIVTKHTMFAESDVFSDLYVYEMGYWNDGMPLGRYRRVLESYGLDGYLDGYADAVVDRVCERDIRDAGEGIVTMDPGVRLIAGWDCRHCMTCVEGCPERALSFADGSFVIDASRCLGTACQRCSEGCPDGVFDHGRFTVER